MTDYRFDAVHVTSLGDAFITPRIPIGEVGVTGLRDDFSAVSFVGAINETMDWVGVLNGAVLEDFTITVAAGVPPTATLDTTSDVVRVKFSTGIIEISTTVPPSVNLTAGTATVPVENYIYILESSGAMAVSTVGWPATEYAPLSRVIIQDSANITDHGPLKQYNYIDHVHDAADQGHLTHVSKWIRDQPAKYIDGIAVTVTGSGGTSLTVATASGNVNVLHPTAFAAIADPAPMYVINDGVTLYRKITNLASITTDSNGVVITSGKSYALVLWGVLGGKLFINAPSGTYTTVGQAQADANNYTNYSIPSAYVGVGFLIRRIVITLSGANYTVTSSAADDLRGKFPNIYVGGAGVVSEYSDAVFRVFKDADPTAKIALSATNISTGVVRTVTFPDASFTLQDNQGATIDFGTTNVVRTLNWGTASGAVQTVNIGSNNGASALNLFAGTGDVTVKLGDSAGASDFIITDLANAVLLTLDSDVGNLTVAGEIILTNAAVTLNTHATTKLYVDNAIAPANAFIAANQDTLDNLAYEVAIAVPVLLDVIDHGTADSIAKIVGSPYVYVALAGTGFAIYNVLNPANIIFIQTIDPGTVGGIAIKGTTLYVSNGSAGLRWYSLTDPLNPVLISTHLAAGGTVYDELSIWGDYLYASATSPSTVHVYDVSVSGTAVYVSTVTTISAGGAAAAADVLIDGVVMYVCLGAPGFQVFDATNKAAIINYGGGGTVVYDNTGLYESITLATIGATKYGFLSANTNNTEVWDLTNPAAATYLTTIPCGGDPSYALAQQFGTDWFLIVAAAGDGLHVFDINNPLAAVETGAVAATPNCEKFLIEGSKLYTAAGTEGFAIYDIGAKIVVSRFQITSTDTDALDMAGGANIDGILTVGGVMNDAVRRSMAHPNGFPNQTDSTISFVSATRTFSITPAAVSYDVYCSSTLYVKDAVESVVITDVEGFHHVYFDEAGVLKETTDKSLVIAKVALIYWDATNDEEVFVISKKYTINVSTANRKIFNASFGALWKSGLALGDFTIGDGSLDAHVQFSVADGVVYDKDIILTVTDGATQDLSPILNSLVVYKSGASLWRKGPHTAIPVYNAPAGRVYYNLDTAGTWSLQEATNNYYVIHFILACPDDDDPINVFMGSAEYATLKTAQLAVGDQLNALLASSNMEWDEFAPIAAFIVQTSNSFTNTAKAKIVYADELSNEWVDLRYIRNTIFTPVHDHLLLSNMNLDTHVQYALLAGRTGDILKVDTINEVTVAAGVTIDGVLLKDSGVTGTIITAAQPNITSLGTLTGLTISGALTVTTGASTTNIGNDAGAGIINIGTGAAARTINVGNITGATVVNVNSGTGGIALVSTGTGDITLASGDTILLDCVGVLELNSSGGVISIGNDAVAQNINIGTGAAARAINVGNASGGTLIDIDAGTGGITLDCQGIGAITLTSQGSGNVALATSSTGNITLFSVGYVLQDAVGVFEINSSGGVISIGNDAVSQDINLGTGGARIINVGNITTTTAVNINSGTGGVDIVSTGTGDITLTSGDTILLDCVGVLELNSSAGVISIGNDAVAQAINIGTGLAARTIAIGNVTGATAVNINSGTGGVGIVSTGTGDITLASGDTILLDCAGLLELNSTAGAINIGNDAVAQAINIGTGAAARTITIGNITGATALVLLAGTGGASLTGSLTITGNLDVNGTTTTVDSANVLINDPHLYINSGYTSVAGKTGGMVVNYLPTATSTTVAAGGFVAGVVATSNPTVATVGAATFSASDIIQISGSNNSDNDGLFEVLSHAANVLTIRGVGVTATVQDFTQNQFITNTTVAGTITKINVSVLRSGTDGVWETAIGSTTGLVFGDLAADSNGISALTSAEVDQLENINTTTISTTQWGYLGALDQGLTQASNVTFNQITGTLQTAAQTNITSVGTLTGLTVSGAFTVTTGANVTNIGADGGTGAINIGTGAATRTVNIGNTTAGSNVNIDIPNDGICYIGGMELRRWDVADPIDALLAGTAFGNVIDGQPSGNFTIGVRGGVVADNFAVVGNTDGTKIYTTVLFAVGMDGTVSLGTAALTGAMNIGTAGARTITIGNATGATTLALNSGTGDITLTSTDAVIIDCAGLLELNSSAGAISVGNDANNGAINIGSATTAGRVITIGNITGTTAVDIKSGSGNVNITGNMTVTGTVDGRDVSTDGSNLDTLYTTIGLSALTSLEVDQLENIGSTAISALQWGYLGGMNQHVSTTTNVLFAGIDITTTVDMSVTGAITISSTTGSISMDVSNAAAAINIGGTASNANIEIGGATTAGRIINIGNFTGTTAINIASGTGGIDLTTVSTGSINLNSANALSIDSAGILAINSSGGAINIGSSTASQPINIGGAGTRTITIGSATASVVVTTGTGDLKVNTTQLVVDQSTARVGIGTAAPSQTLDVSGTTGARIMLQNTGDSSAVIHLKNSTGENYIFTGQTGDLPGYLVLRTSAGKHMALEGGTGSNIEIYTAGTGQITLSSPAALWLLSVTNLSLNCSTGAINIGNDAVTGTINLGTSGARTINIGNTGATTLLLDCSGALELNSSAGAISIGNDATNGAINIGVSSSTGRTLTIGNITGTSRLVLQSGTGDVDISSQDAITLDCSGVLELNSSGGAISIGNDANNGAINLGSGSTAGRTIVIGNSNGTTSLSLQSGSGAINIGTAAAKTITIGNITTTTAVNINSGTGGVTLVSTGAGDIVLTSGDAITLDCAGLLELNSSGGAISIGNDAVAQAINIGTGAAARTITIGNATTTTAILINSGTGDIRLNSSDQLLLDSASILEINSSGGAIGIGNDAVAQDINIGTGAAARNITIGNVTGATGVSIKTGTKGILMPIATVTQTTSINTAVTINSAVGIITTVAAIIQGNTAEEFTVNNDRVLSTSAVFVTIINTSNDGASILAGVDVVLNGSFQMTLGNIRDADSPSSTFRIAFLVINPA